MKKRNLKLTILTLTVAAFLSSNITVFAKPANVEKSQSSSKQQVSNENKNVKKASKKAEKEVRIISHRLDNIEVSLKGVIKKLDVYLSSTATDTTTSSAIDTTTTTSSAIDTSLDGTDSENGEQEVGDLSDDFENEYEEEDNGRYNSFYGKLNAINNRLNTVERQLTKISDSGNPDLAQLKSRVADLRAQVKASMDSLGKVQKQNVDMIKSKSDKKQMEEQKINQDKKTWRIRFTKELQGETITSKNIMIVDSNNNLIDANISYDKNSKSVVIEVKDGFNTGETYSILIGDNVQSTEGEKLAEPVEKKFTVN